MRCLKILNNGTIGCRVILNFLFIKSGNIDFEEFNRILGVIMSYAYLDEFIKFNRSIY